MAIRNKEEVRVYFETNDRAPKDVAKHFNISYRTLMHWIKEEGWERARARKGVSAEVVRDGMLQRELASTMHAGASRIKSCLRENLGAVAGSVDEMILNNMLEASTDEILLQAMSSKFIQNNIALSTLVAKNELMKLVEKKGGTGDPMVIACAEKVAKMFIDMQACLYGKEPAITKLEGSKNAYEDMSDQELLAIIGGEFNEPI